MNPNVQVQILFIMTISIVGRVYSGMLIAVTYCLQSYESSHNAG